MRSIGWCTNAAVRTEERHAVRTCRCVSACTRRACGYTRTHASYWNEKRGDRGFQTERDCLLGASGQISRSTPHHHLLRIQRNFPISWPVVLRVGFDFEQCVCVCAHHEPAGLGRGEVRSQLGLESRAEPPRQAGRPVKRLHVQACKAGQGRSQCSCPARLQLSKTKRSTSGCCCQRNRETNADENPALFLVLVVHDFVCVGVCEGGPRQLLQADK